MLRIICIVGVAALFLEFGLDFADNVGSIASSKTSSYLVSIGE